MSYAPNAIIMKNTESAGKEVPMKRGKLRRISVDGRRYRWNYMYDDMDFSNYPYSYYVFVPEENQRFKIRVYFTKYEPQMKLDAYLYRGTLCQDRGEQAVMNLCRPFFAAQVIRYVFAHCCQDTDVGEVEIRDGEAILEKLGYSDFYRICDARDFEDSH